MESGLPSWKRRTASQVWKDIGSTADLTPSVRVGVLCCPPACSVGVLLSVLFHGLQEWLSPPRGPTQTKLGCVRGVSEHRGRRMKWQSFPLTRCHFPIVSFSWPWGSVDAPGGAWEETRGVLGLGTPSLLCQQRGFPHNLWVPDQWLGRGQAVHSTTLYTHTHT